MFCKWCGKKMANNVSECPVCGKKQGALEQGTHFGDLCENYSANKPSAPVGGVNNGPSALGNTAPGAQHQIKSLLFIVAAAAVGLSLICLIVMFSLSSKLNRVSKDFDEARTTIENLRAEIGELTGNGNTQEGDDPTGETPDSKPNVEKEPLVTEATGDTATSDETPSEEGVPVGNEDALRSVYMHKSAPDPSLAGENIKAADSADLTCTAIRNDGKTEYTVSGNWVDKELLDRWEHTLYWQQSSDSGETWTAVSGKKDKLSVDTTDTDVRYRAVLVVREATIIDLATLEGNTNPELYDVKCDGQTATLTLTGDVTESIYQIGWRRSKNGGDWEDGTIAWELNQSEETDMTEANNTFSYSIEDGYKYNALVIHRNTYYYAEAAILSFEPVDSDAEVVSVDTVADNHGVGGALGGTGDIQ